MANKLRNISDEAVIERFNIQFSKVPLGLAKKIVDKCGQRIIKVKDGYSVVPKTKVRR
ncbi:MAG: hypothetical protein NT099_03995 [Candidatus Saganbacteria bacterium]|nr:hypothetical protein [Candidatus Saganbacteria bacterium]